MQRYQAVVAGAGPAGIATVATLLDFAKKPFNLLWVDPEFNAGRLSSYMEVPSNTKVSLFIQFVTTSPTLNAIASKRQSLADLQKLPGDKGCELSHVAKLCRELSDGLRHHPQVTAKQCMIESVVRARKGWQVAFDDDAGEVFGAEGDSVYLCTGSVPAKYTIEGAKELPLLTALKPSELQERLPTNSRVVVVGNSHSAILVLKNLKEMPNPPIKVVHYARNPLKYAVYMDGWILYDNTGLKGVAAEWAKQVLDKDSVDWPGYTRVKEDDMFKKAVQELQLGDQQPFVVPAVGFARVSIPKVSHQEPLSSLTHDRATGQLQCKEVGQLPGLYGFGIAFPELWTDPQGNKENHVGLWKFMKYIRRTVPQHLGVQSG